MEKNIKDYLHLYLGCPHRYKYVDSEGWMIWSNLNALRLTRLDDLSIDAIQLALRPLSDITDEEKFEAATIQRGKLNWKQDESNGKYVYDKIDGLRHCFYYLDADNFSPNTTIYLLSKHFDLFGLIESGLAIDKTKL